MLIEPQTGSLYVQENMYLNLIEKEMEQTMKKVIEIAGKHQPSDELFTASETLLFPNMSEVDMVKGMPPAIILTEEFDYNRKMAEEAGLLFLKSGKLLEFGCIAGTYHGFYSDFDLQRTNAWFKTVASLVNKYLE
jgi:hypothetical protein